jgi:hypothetical protein
MTNTNEKIHNAIHPFEMTNSCICYKTDDEGEAVLDSYGEPVPSDYCYGCYDEELDNLEYCVIATWREWNSISDDTLIRIEGSGMGWTNAKGYTFAKANAKSMVEALSINTEWTLRFRVDDYDNLIVVRSSHDELGARFEFRVATEDEVADYEM